MPTETQKKALKNGVILANWPLENVTTNTTVLKGPTQKGYNLAGRDFEKEIYNANSKWRPSVFHQ